MEMGIMTALRKVLHGERGTDGRSILLFMLFLLAFLLGNSRPALSASTETPAGTSKATVVNVETSAPLCSSTASNYQVVEMIWLGRTVDVLEKTTGAVFTDYISGGSSNVWYKIKVDMNNIWYTGYMSSLHLSLIQETPGTPGPTVTGTIPYGITWKLSSAGVLTVSGKGAMLDYDAGNSTGSPGYAPWYYYSPYIREIVVQNGVTAVGECAFYGCSRCTKVTVAGSVTSIGPGSFSGCDGLEEVVLPFSGTRASTNDFWDGQFSNMFSEQVQDNTLKKVTITKVPPMEQAFKDCRYLETILLPEGTVAIPYRCFENCSALSAVCIPQSVSAIMGYGFYSCTALTEVTVPGHVVQIGEYAFSECSALKTVTIEEGCRTIMESAFYSCAALESVRLPDSLKTIGDWCFDQDPSLVSVVVPDGVTELGNTFNYCNALNSVTIGSGVRRLSGFLKDPNLKTVSIGKNVEEIEAFYECAALTEIVIPNGVKTILPYSFRDCTSLKAVVIPDSVTVLGNNSFTNCTALTSAKIGNRVEQLEYAAFQGCISLKDLSLGSGLRTIDGFYGCIGLEEVVLPEQTVSIDGFSACTSLRHVDMPNTVTSITGFGNCPALRTVRFHGLRAEWEAITFGQYAEDIRNCTVVCDDTGLPGDVTGDLTVDLKDVAFLFRVCIGTETHMPDMSVCDVNGDGVFSLIDVAVLYRRYVAVP